MINSLIIPQTPFKKREDLKKGFEKSPQYIHHINYEN